MNLTIKQTVISTIPTVGPELTIKLDRHFNSIQALCNASKEELMKVDGLGKLRASIIYRFVRNII